MAEYIEREALLTEIAELHMKHKLADNEEMMFSESDIRGLVLCLPAAEVEPVRHGYWKWVGGVPYCSVCGEAAPGDPYDGAVYTTSRCPNCGARMDGGTENG